MYLLAKFGDNRSHRNGNINSYISSYRDTLEKAALTASIRHIVRFLKSEIPIYNSEIPLRLTEKQEAKKKEHRHLLNVLSFTQTQCFSFS